MTMIISQDPFTIYILQPILFSPIGMMKTNTRLRCQFLFHGNPQKMDLRESIQSELRKCHTVGTH